jgi:hypothetical protein
MGVISHIGIFYGIMGGWRGAVTAFEELLVMTCGDDVPVDAVFVARFEAFADATPDERSLWLAAILYDLTCENPKVVPATALLTNTGLPITVFVWPDIIERVLSCRLATYVSPLEGEAKVRIAGYLFSTLSMAITVFVWPDIIERVLSCRLRTYTLALYWFKATNRGLWTTIFSESALAPPKVDTELIA